jgi:hypothetical protein
MLHPVLTLLLLVVLLLLCLVVLHACLPWAAGTCSSCGWASLLPAVPRPSHHSHWGHPATPGSSSLLRLLLCHMRGQVTIVLLQ